jgi:Na+/H+ antiporter NhaC
MACLDSVIFIPYIALLAAAGPAAEPLTVHREQRFSIEVPDVVLTDVPVRFIRITARKQDGSIDRDYNGRPLILGIRLSRPQDVDRDLRIRSARVREDAELPPFRNGVLELETDLSKRRKVYIVDREIVVDPKSRHPSRLAITQTLRWFSIVPPLLAIVLVVWLRNVIVGLFAGVYCGAVILAHGNFFQGFIRTLDTYVLGEFAPVERGLATYDHLMILFFTIFLGAMVGVMRQSGGTKSLVNRLARFTRKREHGQLMTWALGLVIFFDDYANTLLVGSTMKPLTDRLRISREKLAFLVDSTAAPVAGLAIVSTWVGVEIGYIADTYRDLGLGDANVFDVFLATIPYRFYPIHLLVFVGLIAYIGHDYGPMLRAEARAFNREQQTHPDTIGDIIDGQHAEVIGRRSLIRNALIPLITLLMTVAVGLWWTGSDNLQAANLEAVLQGNSVQEESFLNIIGMANSTRVLFLSSFVAAIVAVASAALTRSLTIPESMDAWARGATSMLYPLFILILAWSVATICDPEHLNTASFLVELSDGKVSAVWMPTLAFLVAGTVAFATGSSWSTMGLLMPLFISVTHYLLVDANDAGPTHHLMLGTIGGILAGSIFGDHCSPISDTTVLSSAASGCDHLAHVNTQLPYAASVAGVALLLGYVPAGFGYSPIVLLPLGLIVLFVLVQFLGRPCEQLAVQMDDPDDHAADPSTDGENPSRAEDDSLTSADNS